MAVPRFLSQTPGNQHQTHEESRTLAAEAARAASGNTQTDFECIPDCSSVIGILTLTTGATGDALDLLDVYIQTYIHDTWVDVIRFTQIIGTDADDQYFAKIDKLVATVEFEIGTGLAAAAVRNLLGSRWAARWVVTDGAGAGTHTWTFGVDIQPVL